MIQMEKQNKKTTLIDDGKDLVTMEEIIEKRVVLNLTKDQAQRLITILKRESEEEGEDADFAKSILIRLDKTILRQAFIERCERDGFKATKEQIKKFMRDLK
jgi:hypothetical protein